MKELISYSQHEFIGRDDLTFDPTQYSLYKYGSGPIARQFGVELANGFINSKEFADMISNFGDKRIVVLCSPYGYIQSAATVIQREFMKIFNLQLIKLGLSPAAEYKTTRDKYYTVDYASMTGEERRVLINGDVFHISKSFLSDKILIHIDDIKITGGHQEVIERIFNENELYETGSIPVFLYYASLVGKGENPNIEAYLNNYYVKELHHLNNIVKKDYEFNTRAIKFILGAPEQQFISFVEMQEFSFLANLMQHSIGEGYWDIERFRTNLDTLIHYVTGSRITKDIVQTTTKQYELV
jgi:hypothetical protein